jgi:hypothetical protein
MKAQKLLFVVAALLVAGIGDSWADRRVYGRVGVYVGPGPYWGPAYPRPYYYPRPFYPGPYFPGPYLYGDPFYSPAPVVVVPPEPSVYIEQSDSAVERVQSPAQQYWYFCRGSNRYYPYVKECPGGWQTVLPQPGQ